MGTEDKTIDRGDELDTKDESGLTDEDKKELDHVIDAKDEDGDKGDDKKDAEAKDEDKGDDKKDAKSDDKKGDDKDKDDDAKRIRIPKARFDDAMRKARAREEALQKELQDARAAAPKQDKEVEELAKALEAAEDKYEQAIFDGKAELAKQYRAEKNKLQTQLVNKQAETIAATSSASARDVAVDQIKYDTLLARYEEEFPELNQDASEFDEDLVREISFDIQAYVSRGLSRATALQRAVKNNMGQRKAGKGQEDLDKIDSVEARRKERDERARIAAANASKKQPPRSDKVGEDSDKHGGDPLQGKGIFSLSQEAFAKLSEEALSKMRGDSL